jgi:hypothetical protein
MNATNSYPDTISESNKVIKKMKNSDSEYFLMSDESPVKPFTEYMDRHKLDYDAKKLKSIVLESYQPIKSLKDYYNRPRPHQVNPKIIPQPSSTANTPAYPAGHSTQSFLLARYLSREYPFHSFYFYRIAERIGQARIKAGLHYPSDHKFAKKVAEILEV